MIYFVNIILLLVHLVLVNGINGLPKSSEEFIVSYTCNGTDVQKLLEQRQQHKGGDFFKWVLAARHTTHQSGWEVNTSYETNDTNNSNKYYARVFDLLNYSRIHNLLPHSIGVDEVCHKGMETQYQLDDKNNNWSDDNDKSKPNTYITSESWDNLCNLCHKQLSSSERLSSTCIDIPGVVVKSPFDKANNPCNRKYRMVDGAHRMCLRKFLLLLLHGEVSELENEALNKNFDKHKMIQQKKQLIEIYSQSMFIVLNQTVFESMLMDDDPHTTWARDKPFLVKAITHDLQLDWKEWMGRVMDRVDERKSNFTLSTSNQDMSRDEL